MDEKLIADILQAEAFNAMASLYGDIRKLRRRLKLLPNLAPDEIENCLKLLDEMEKKLAP